MADQIRKKETIRSIKDLQLSSNLILALEHSKEAEDVVQAVEVLMAYNQAWY